MTTDIIEGLETLGYVQHVKYDGRVRVVSLQPTGCITTYVWVARARERYHNDGDHVSISVFLTRFWGTSHSSIPGGQYTRFSFPPIPISPSGTLSPISSPLNDKMSPLSPESGGFVLFPLPLFSTTRLS